jgi:hypothetical protein
MPERYRPHKNCVSRIDRWRQAANDRLILDPGASARRQRTKKAAFRCVVALTINIHALVDACGLAISEGQLR